MDLDLDHSTQRWFALLERREAAAALELFCSLIIPAIADKIRERFHAEYPGEANGGRYQGLITLLGYTPDTSILAARFTEATEIAILHTPDTAPFVDDVRKYCGVPNGAVHAVSFDRHRPGDLPRAFGEAVGAITRANRIGVEVTGGTKPMSTALHVAAALQNMDTLYIDYERYDPLFRKPMPDSISIRLMESPLRSMQDNGLLSTFETMAEGLASIRGGLKAVSEKLSRGSIEVVGAAVHLDEVTTKVEALEKALTNSKSWKGLRRT